MLLAWGMLTHSMMQPTHGPRELQHVINEDPYASQPAMRQSHGTWLRPRMAPPSHGHHMKLAPQARCLRPAVNTHYTHSRTHPITFPLTPSPSTSTRLVGPDGLDMLCMAAFRGKLRTEEFFCNYEAVAGFSVTPSMTDRDAIERRFAGYCAIPRA